MKRKTTSGIMLSLLLIGMLILAFNIQPVGAEPKTWTVDDDGPADFSSIQEAINAANPGDTIFVHNGTYYERVDVNKTVSLIGENRDSTIISNWWHVFDVLANNVVISGFTLESEGFHVFIDGKSGVTVSGNLLITENSEAMAIKGGSHNKIINNTILSLNLTGGGITIYESTDNIIDGSNIVGGAMGIFLTVESSQNLIANNTIRNTVTVPIIDLGAAILMDRSSYNVIYHNNFINNTKQVDIFHAGYPNYWDNGYPSGGNYWSDHACTGNPSDGSQPYILDADNIDHYPFQNPNGWLLPPPTPPSVGGKATPINKVTINPVNKLELLAPYIGLTILLAVAVAVVTLGYVKKRKRNTKINS